MLGGCTQATRHANMMIFGTNTVVGLTVGKDVDTPAINVGYKRQELVLMPLVANTIEGPAGNLSPCPMSSGSRTVERSGPSGSEKITETGATAEARADHPCLLVAVRNEGANKVARDSYSVLASFGADFEAGSGASLDAKGGLAQYFSTGMAAQLLALRGGASLVAVGAAASASAANPPDPEAVAALSGDPALAAAIADPAIIKQSNLNAVITRGAAAQAQKYLGEISVKDDFDAEVKALSAEVGLGDVLERACSVFGRDECLAQLPVLFAGRDPNRTVNAVRKRIEEREKAK